jgi:D-alanyl-D-alanine endopeptidase (penicillin-binding protein 7)
MTPRYKTDDFGNLVPDVRAAAAIIYNPQTGDVLWEANSHDQRSIASLTKMMTAVTFIADDPDLSQRVAVTRADVLRASVTYIRAGDVLTYRDLLHLTLIASDNAAARVLARTSEGGTAAFVTRMNQMARHLGLVNSQYADPSGLDARNVSTAYDQSHLMAFATSDERLGPVMRTSAFDVRTNRRSFTIRNTNRLLGTDLGTDVDVLAGKTGFIRKAGYCLATLLQGPQGSQVAVVVLGATNSTIRFWEARHLFNWAMSRMPGVLATATAPFVATQD